MLKSLTPNLMVDDVTETIEFYEQLGFSTAATVPNETNDGLQFAILVKDSVTLMAQEKNNFAKEYPAMNMKDFKPSVSLYIQVDDLYSLYEELAIKKLIYSDLKTTFYGAKEFAILDNSGYVLTFTEATN